MTSETHSQALPELPTIGEFVHGYEASVWNGVVAPKNTLPDIIERLYKEIDAALADPEIITRFANVGSITKSMTPADFGKFIVDDTEKWGRIIQAANIRVDRSPAAIRSHRGCPLSARRRHRARKRVIRFWFPWV